MFSTSLIDREQIAEMTAKMLLEINAVHFNAQRPYMFTSGIVSPVYIDCRKIISHPHMRDAMMDFMTSMLVREIGFEKIQSVAGGETAGIPFAAWIAAKLGLPMQYVRKKPKGFGKDAQIEGDLKPGQTVLLVEDLTTDGGSKVNFCNALRRAGAEVTDASVIFFYDIFEETTQMLEREGIRLHSLATWRDVLSVCKTDGYFEPDTLAEVENFLNHPLEWSAKHGGASQITPS
ncbi:orotate phosphoribosyltransferase [Qingshengfaniella alkalisoli]|uniref:Orotate phosphoribosyltransferase n=1 Tax=Qingshengfaniella alkalisoli TaxID=2599296 RepID=A0A5B8I926_9RHOB|nr:orotate phosphoribosyltransferase [Qingshengfaniella alkalisoli]QDY69376.1 orotate phosphoribosyltransferase [Qingshengfaniella alkalisoli]